MRNGKNCFAVVNLCALFSVFIVVFLCFVIDYRIILAKTSECQSVVIAGNMGEE